VYRWIEENPMAQDRTHDADAMRQLAALNRIARIAVQDLAWQPMLQRIVDMLSQEFGWEFVACATVDRKHNEFLCEAVAGIDSEASVGYRRALGSGIVGRCALTGETFDIDDARNHPDVVDTLRGTGSELCVPVQHNGRILAVLNAESHRVGAFRGQRALLETVADQIAGILWAAHLLESMQLLNEELREANVALDHHAKTDSLTGIANRRCFDAWLAADLASAAARHEPLALAMIDIDCFKAYNDGYGHVAGDQCLQSIASLLAYVLDDAPARLARYGGEEFAVILPRSDLRDACVVGDRLRRAVQARSFEHRCAPGGLVTISVGAAASDAFAEPTAGAMIEAADAALYEAKRRGRNRVAQAPQKCGLSAAAS